MDFKWIEEDTNNDFTQYTDPREVIENALEEITSIANGLKEILELIENR